MTESFCSILDAIKKDNRESIVDILENYSFDTNEIKELAIHCDSNDKLDILKIIAIYIVNSDIYGDVIIELLKRQCFLDGVINWILDQVSELKHDVILQYTTYRGNIDILKRIYCLTPSISEEMINQCLKNGVLFGNTEVIRFFIDIGADPCGVTTKCRMYSLELLNLIEEFDAEHWIDGCQLMHTGITNKELDILIYTLEHFGTKYMTDEIFKWAFSSNYLDRVNIILEYGYVPDKKYAQDMMIHYMKIIKKLENTGIQLDWSDI